MEDWPKDFFEMLEVVAHEVEQFFIEVTEILDTVADEVQTTITTEIDQRLEELFEPIIGIYAELEEASNQTEQPFIYYDFVEPTAERHPACIGCNYYHGHAYSGNLLVCGMHPYGWDDSNCPDWKSTENQSSDSTNIF